MLWKIADEDANQDEDGQDETGNIWGCKLGAMVGLHLGILWESLDPVEELDHNRMPAYMWMQRSGGAVAGFQHHCPQSHLITLNLFSESQTGQELKEKMNPLPYVWRLPPGKLSHDAGYS